MPSMKILPLSGSTYTTFQRIYPMLIQFPRGTRRLGLSRRLASRSNDHR